MNRTVRLGRQLAFHTGRIDAAHTAAQRLTAVFQWLRAECRRSGPEVTDRVNEYLLAEIRRLRSNAEKEEPTK